MGFLSLLWGFSFFLPLSVWKHWFMFYILKENLLFFDSWDSANPWHWRDPREVSLLPCPPVCCHLQGPLQKWEEPSAVQGRPTPPSSDNCAAGAGPFPFINGGICRGIGNCESAMQLSEANCPWVFGLDFISWLKWSSLNYMVDCAEPKSGHIF